MAQQIEHILVPTDGSDAALHAAQLACGLARGLGARVTVLLVHPESLIPALTWNSSLSVEEARKQFEEESAKTSLEETRAALGDLEPAPELLQRWGHPADEICRFAESAGVDLIVMGSHGRSGLARLALGSVSHAVTLHAPCPVTVVR
jgi:nucleotide-binding universal stress UspA family protein